MRKSVNMYVYLITAEAQQNQAGVSVLYPAPKQKLVVTATPSNSVVIDNDKRKVVH